MSLFRWNRKSADQSRLPWSGSAWTSLREAAHLSVTTTLGQEPGTREGRLCHAAQRRGKVLIGSSCVFVADRVQPLQSTHPGQVNSGTNL
jgi:hypothetical protein